MRFWTSIKKKLPPLGREVVGWNESWLNDDFNPRGTCACFLTDSGWVISWWCSDCDEYHTKRPGQMSEGEFDPGEPTHWVWMPVKTKPKAKKKPMFPKPNPKII
jgi:hypothetical protein